MLANIRVEKVNDFFYQIPFRVRNSQTLQPMKDFLHNFILIIILGFILNNSPFQGSWGTNEISLNWLKRAAIDPWNHL